MLAATVSAGELAGDILATAPAPQNPPADNAPSDMAPPAPGAQPAANNPPANSPLPPAPGNPLGKDRDGVEFDPAKHLPEKDENRRWRKLKPAKRGRPSASSSSSSAPESPATAASEPAKSESYVAPDSATPAPAAAAPSGPDKYDLAADMYCRAFYAVADSAFEGRGEWVPDDDAEHEALRNAAAAYMRAKGLEDLPPGPALLMAVGTFAAKRIQRPNTNTRWRMAVAFWKAKFASWWTSRKIERLNPLMATPAPAT